MLHLHYYLNKQKILNLSRTKGQLMYEGTQVHICPDMSPEIGKLRGTFNEMKKKPYEACVTYSLFYPARLTITLGSDTTSSGSGLDKLLACLQIV